MAQTIAENLRPSIVTQRRGLVFAAALIATFMAAVESTIVATAMPTIVADLGGFALFSWVFAAYLLTMAVSIPVYGRLADVYGRKRVFFTGTGIFLVGTTLCGCARTMVALILFRALQGLGAGAIQPIASTVLGDIYSPAERARIQGYVSSVFGISAVIGPTLGAYLVQHLHWSLVFWVNLPIGVLSIAMFAVFLHERVEPRQHRIDYLGGVLLVIGVGALMLALVQAVTLSAGMILALVALGLAALALLYWHERRVPEPMLPVSLWGRRLVLVCNLAGFCAAAVMMSVTAVLPAYVQGVMGRSPNVAGIVVGATSVSWMFASIFAGRLMIWTSYRLTASLGGAVLVLGALVLATLDAGSTPFHAAAGSFLIGISMGFCNTTFLVAIQANVARNERGIGTGSQMFMRMVGQAVGAALLGAILNFGMSRLVPGKGDAVNQLLHPALRDELPAAEVARLADAFARSVHDAYLVIVMIAIATLVLARCLPRGLSPIRAATDPAER
ncbi:MAG TPA: MDR family MFS transporter [Stellaceae bacterium]|nr:MDR family MFS transporter [Stellaceae bacterium]